MEITVTAPTLGLVTRIPSNQPDTRAATVGINVRYDDGVIRNAPGFEIVALVPPVDSPVNLIHQSVLTSFGVTTKRGFIATVSKIYLVGSG